MSRTGTRTAAVAAAALAAALAATQPAGAYPLDVENAARWAVLDGMPERASGRAWPVEVRGLRTRDLVHERAMTVSAVCGVLDFLSGDDGRTNFVVWFGTDDDGKAVRVGEPFLYGPLSAWNGSHEPRYMAAQEVCGATMPEATPVVAASR